MKRVILGATLAVTWGLAWGLVSELAPEGLAATLDYDDGMACEAYADQPCLKGVQSYGAVDVGTLAYTTQANVQQNGDALFQDSYRQLQVFLTTPTPLATELYPPSAAEAVATGKGTTRKDAAANVAPVDVRRLTRLFNDCVDYGCVGAVELSPSQSGFLGADHLRAVVTLDGQDPAIGGSPTLRVFGLHGNTAFQLSKMLDGTAFDTRAVEDRCLRHLNRPGSQAALDEEQVMACFIEYYQHDATARQVLQSELNTLMTTFSAARPPMPTFRPGGQAP
ncbi:MAG: hypothetical protein KC476_05185 [Cyanobacteria bacterium HKST-UBA06]|nr:hypothetical protein [Cyanobacteria bacterium HKST-UBA06]